MSNGTVGSNTATTGGGGVFVAGGTFTMNDGTVNGNTTLIGGGVFVDSSATFAMNGGVVSNNVFPNPYGLGLGREVAVWGGTFKMSGAARPERIFLRSNTRFITISGPLSGGTAPIDLGFDNNSPLTSWVGKPVLVLDGSYGAGNLANLKTYFTLGNAQLTIEPYTETPIPANYTIGNDGKLTN
jgi:hypothetical protein